MKSHESCGTIDGLRRHQSLHQAICPQCEPMREAYLDKLSAMRGGRAVRREMREHTRAVLERPRSCPLTEREWDVALLVTQGHSNLRISEELGISEHTVKTHLRNALVRLGVANRSELAVALYRRGWLPTDLADDESVVLPRATFAAMARLVHLVRYSRLDEARELARKLAPALPPPRTMPPAQKGGVSS
jgi:DNA-binding CsgD family transcriptional regulator